MTISVLACVMGAASLLAGGVMALAPAGTRHALSEFPRSRWPAWALTAAALLWSAWLVRDMEMGQFDVVKPWLPIIAVVGFGLIVYFMDELLAPRALGGLLMLVPTPILDIQRWHASAWRWVLGLLAYAMVIKGMLLVLGPYRFRKWTERYLPTDAACRRAGAACAALGAGLIALGLTVF